MPLPRWTLFSPLVIVMVAGLTVRCHPHPPRRTKTGGKSASAPDFALQPARSLDAPRVTDAASARFQTTQDTLYGPPAPVKDAHPLEGEGASVAALAASGSMGGMGLPDADARSVTGETWPTVGAAKQRRNAHGEKGVRDGDDGGDAAGEGGARWTSPHYAAWTPAPIYGPPCPPERMQVRRQAHRLLQDLEAGRLEVMMDERDGEQLRGLERDGVYGWPAPPPGVAVRSPRQRDVLEGTLEESDASFVSSNFVSSGLALNERGSARNSAATSAHAGLTLASRGALPRRSPTINSADSANPTRSAVNPADDPDFDPCILPPAPGLLRMLTTLAAHSAPARPLRVMSLLRPPYRMGDFVHVGPANPHSLGLAVDIAAYGGYGIRQSNPEQCVKATLALLRDLPPGRYRLGMPKAPEGGWELPPALSALLHRAEGGSLLASEAEVSSTSSPKGNKPKSAPRSEKWPAASPARESLQYASRSSDTRTEQEQAAMEKIGNEKIETEKIGTATGCATAALYGLYASCAKPAWPFFPPPYLAMLEAGQPDDLSAPAAPSGLHSSAKPVLRFQNEAYAPENALIDARLRRALQLARQRGVDVIALFPDGADHIHVDVRQNL